ALVKRTGTDLGVSVAMPRELAAAAGGTGAVALGLLLPAVQKVRDAAGRTASMNNLKQIGLAMHGYHDVNAGFPMAGHPGPKNLGKPNAQPLLSWRVYILPYVEQINLYNQFKLDEPWDSEHNKK